MDLTVVIPFFNGHDTLGRLLETLPSGLPVIVVDDISDKPLLTVNRENTRIIRMGKKGYFTGAVNRGLTEVKTDALILNQDTYFENDNWLNLLEEKSKDYGLIGEGITRHSSWPKGYIHGTFMHIRQDVYQKLGPMNEELYPLWGSTCEYQLRACRAGFKALPIGNGKVPGFVHLRERQFGTAIESLVRKGISKSKFLKTPPAISVIITSFNYGRYLQDAVNSLIGGKTSLGEFEPQTFQSFDIIIVDDSSTDGSTEMALNLADDWKGIKVITRSKRGGTPASLNEGISSTRAHYITHLCGDDMMLSGRLEMLHTAAENNPHRVIHDNLLPFSHGMRGVMVEDSRGMPHRMMKYPPSQIPDVYDFNRIIEKNGMHTGIFYPKKAWEEIGGYSEIMTNGREDWQMNIALGIKGWCGVKAKPAGYLYRREGQNRTRHNTTPSHNLQFKRQLMSLYPKIFKGFRPVGCCGGSTNKNGVSTMAKSKTTTLLGATEGFQLVEYTGDKWGDGTYRVKGTAYRFGLNSPIKNVVLSHVDTLLDVVENNRKVFTLVKEEPEPIVIVKKLFDPNNYTANQLTDKLVGYLNYQLEEILQLEKDDRNRTTVIKKIEGAIENG